MEGENQMPAGPFQVYSYEELAQVTGSFSHDFSLGSGGFGDVFLGKINNRYIAIKKLKFNTDWDEDEEQERIDFQSEIRALSTINHQNLVKLIGYCSTGRDRLIVCEYCSNRSLHWHLHDAKAPTLSWSARMKIAIGSAKGIEYLHENCQHKIIHRDIKPANIVLELNFQAKVVDFGLARFFPIGDKTHISSLLRGTAVYADPEYGPEFQRVSEKSDVYSFGVVLLELISGRESEIEIDVSSSSAPTAPAAAELKAKSPILQALGPENNIQELESGRKPLVKLSIIEWAKHRILQALGPESNIQGLIDPKLMKKEKKLPIKKIKMMICCAAASVYKPSKDRPQMKKIVQALKMEIPSNEIWDMSSDEALLRT